MDGSALLPEVMWHLMTSVALQAFDDGGLRRRRLLLADMAEQVRGKLLLFGYDLITCKFMTFTSVPTTHMKVSHHYSHTSMCHYESLKGPCSEALDLIVHNCAGHK